MKKIYIHIGMPKTGTSSIQNALTKNNQLFLKNGLFYPLIGTNYSTGYVNGLYFKNDYKKNFVYNNLLLLKRTSILRKALDQFAKNDCHTLLFSEENLFEHYNDFCTAFKKFRFFKKFDVKIIIYYRRSVEYIAEIWAQTVKSNRQVYYQKDGSMVLVDLDCHKQKNISEVSLVDFLANYAHKDNFNTFQRLSETFGKENIILRPFEKEQWKNNDLLDDFFSIFGIELNDEFNLQNVNITPNRIQIEKINYMNSFLPARSFDGFIKTKELMLDSKENQSIVESLPDSIIKKSSEDYHKEECRIAKEFLERDEMFNSKYPSFYGKRRNTYAELIFDNEEKEELQKTVQLIKNKYRNQ
ncbi:hypothetical protein [Maridesulfovibrio sp.]|uniref:hypothetical protein n=1 Tax=Maridesulfovibrio sp. TaxID=2795000 RepID=UPI0029C9F44B|nr:hypothetical protein [Maridesulfovibrio sp.]